MSFYTEIVKGGGLYSDRIDDLFQNRYTWFDLCMVYRSTVLLMQVYIEL